MSDTEDQGKVAHISAKGKKKAKDDLNSFEKISHLAFLIGGWWSKLPKELRSLQYPFRYEVIGRKDRDDPDIYQLVTVMADHEEMDPPRQEVQICVRTSFNSMVSDLVNWVESSGFGPLWRYQVDHRLAQRVIQHFIDLGVNYRDPPKTVAFRSEEDLAIFKLPFDPIGISANDLEAFAPTFAEMMGRISNNKALMARIGSIFDPAADRKQAIYVSGVKDSGKSQLMNIIGFLCGVHSFGGGAYAILSPGDTYSAHWKESLINKRVVVVAEASASFLNTDAFKSVTGDCWHNVNPKGKTMHIAKLEPLFFFFSNQPPEIDSKPELIERIIDCRITPPNLKNTELMPEGEYQERLKKELPFFVGACLSEWQSCNGGRIPHDSATLMDSIEDKEQWAYDIFEDLFIDELESWITCQEFRRLFHSLNYTKNMTRKDYSEFLRIIENRYMVKRDTKWVDGLSQKVMLNVTKRTIKTDE